MGVKRKSTRHHSTKVEVENNDKSSKIRKTGSSNDGNATSKKSSKEHKSKTASPLLPFDYRYIMAPMVGASELPFRLFCRKYGTQLCYTPMMMASEFATSEEYRQREFPISVLDRPLVCHFAANTPQDFAIAAKLAEPFCDAIDLNLGCPQRTAYVGHFGSYLLDPQDRALILSIIRAGVEAVSIPIFVKIRLLDTYEETEELVRQLYEAGATLIAVHARYRATFDRKGPGARDGPALLDQVSKLKQAFPNKLLITNGNTITYDDVEKNLDDTKADGLMSAEGILDNPALFLSRLQNDDSIPIQGGDESFWKQRQEKGEKLFAKLKKIEKVERKLREAATKASSQPEAALTPKEKQRLAKKSKVIAKLAKLDESIFLNSQTSKHSSLITARVKYSQLERVANDKTLLALEYLQWVRHYPTTMRTIIFHTRRILKVELTTYQLLQDCLSCQTVDQVEAIIQKIRGYQSNPETFHYDKVKAQQEKDAIEKQKQEEGKRKAYEARMVRKAKREGKQDLEFYLRQGAVVPTEATVKELLTLPKEEQLRLWKERDHSQHCIGFHLGGGVCHRGRSCAFLHVASTTANTFDESNEVAG